MLSDLAEISQCTQKLNRVKQDRIWLTIKSIKFDRQIISLGNGTKNRRGTQGQLLDTPLYSWVFVLKSEVWSSCWCLLGSRWSQAANVVPVSTGVALEEHGLMQGSTCQLVMVRAAISAKRMELGSEVAGQEHHVEAIAAIITSVFCISTCLFPLFSSALLPMRASMAATLLSW